MKISTHALRVERDIGRGNRIITGVKFQLTRSVWSATLTTRIFSALTSISTHALRVERDNLKENNNVGKHIISTHALRVERDP